MGILHGDCLTGLRFIADESMDSLVTDPPAGIGFMGKDWDGHKGGRDAWTAWLASVMAEALRVLKPGAHGLVWAMPRTSHWTATALEDAGFEIRDCIVHLQGQGFPKSNGQLKPGNEHWWLVRKKGPGRLNIDACRIGTGEPIPSHHATGGGDTSFVQGNLDPYQPGDAGRYTQTQGRWPANVILSHSAGCVQVGERKVKSAAGTEPYTPNREVERFTVYVGGGGDRGDVYGYADADGTETIAAYDCEPGCPVAGIDTQSGERPSGGGSRRPSGRAFWGDRKPDTTEIRPPSTGGASRFFTTIDPDPPYLYTSKAPPKERPTGPDGTKHPTVKSLALMRWLCKLITPPGGRVLDPFAGSGATVEAAILEGFRYLAIEQEPAYIPLIHQRIERTGLLGMTA